MKSSEGGYGRRLVVGISADHAGMRRLCILACMAALAGDEVRLVNGEVIEGEVLSAEGAAEVRVRLVLGTMSAERSFPSVQVAQVVRGASPRTRALAELRAEASRLGDNGEAPAWMALADRAQRLGDTTLARGWAQRAVALDRGNEAAQRLLGRELVNGVWMRPHEVAAARGLVWYDGRWMPWSERERMQAEDRRRHEEQLAAARALAERRQQAADRQASVELPSEIRFVADTPLKMIYWGGWPGGHRPCPIVPYDPILSLQGSGSWGGVDWKFRLNW